MTDQQISKHADYIMNSSRQLDIFKETIRSSSVYGNVTGLKNDEKIQPQLPQYPINEIKSPVLAIHGEYDAEVPISHAKNLVSQAPDSSLTTIDASHLTWLGPDTPKFENKTQSFVNKIAE